MRQTFFITGTDTGVGKTLLTRLVAEFLIGRQVKVAAFKPLCSGGRADAHALYAALRGALTLDEINPWHFRAALTPAMAARREKKSVSLKQVLAHIRAKQNPFSVILVEGAGGLLSPLGIDFDSRDLLLPLHATPLIVAPNRLGAVNHVLLTREALPPHLRNQAKIILMSPPKADRATSTNSHVLAQWIPKRNLLQLPWFGETYEPRWATKTRMVTKTLQALITS
jgi:dethiobiotin synthetase